MDVAENLTFGFADVAGIKLALPNIKFKAKFTVTNNTNIPFGANLSSKIALRQIRVYNRQGQFLGTADTNFYQIDLPPFTTVELPWFEITADALKTFLEIGGNVTSYMNGDYSNLIYQIDVNIFGKTVTLDA